MNAAKILNVFGSSCLLLFAIQLIATVKTHRGLNKQAFLQMSLVSMSGGKALLLFVGLGGIAATLLRPVLSDWIPPYPPFLIVGISLLALNGACLPPTVLFLAASKAGGFSFASGLPSAVAPLKVVHLLDSFQAGGIIGKALHENEYRVNTDWQRAVRRLSTFTPVIIVDIRELTANVYQEIVHLMESELHNRVFLIAERAQAPAAISRLCDQFDVQICIVTPQLLEVALEGIGWAVLFRPVTNVFRLIEIKMLNLAG